MTTMITMAVAIALQGSLRLLHLHLVLGDVRSRLRGL